MTRVCTYLIGLALTCLFVACDSTAEDKNAFEGVTDSGGSAVSGNGGAAGGTEDVVIQTSGGANGAALGGTGSVPGLIDAGLDGAVTTIEGDSGEAEIGDAGTDAAVTDAATDAASDASITSDGEIPTQSDAGPTTLPPLDDQTPPRSANGIAIDEKGLLWIAVGWDSQILRLNPPPDVKIVERYGEAEGIYNPDDLVIDEHFVYWTGVLDGTVGKLDRDSGQSTVIGKTGKGANPIAFGNNGMLLVGSTEIGGIGLFEVDPEEKVALRTISENVDSNGFSVAPDGFLYGASYDDVIKVDLTTGTFETLVAGFTFCCSVRYNPQDGYLYVLEFIPASIYRVSLDGSSKELFATLSDQYSTDNFAITEDGTFLVTRFNDPIITRVSADGLTIEDFSIGE